MTSASVIRAACVFGLASLLTTCSEDRAEGVRLVVVGTIRGPLPGDGGLTPVPDADVRVSAHPNDDCFAPPFATGGDGTDATGAYEVILTAGGFAPRRACVQVHVDPSSESPFVGTGVGDDEQRFAGPDEPPDTLRIDLTLGRRVGF